MANMVVKTKYPKNPKQIMLADSQMVSFGVIIGNEGVTADSNGKKILKAGTPITGDIEARNTAFKKATSTTSGEPAATTSNAVGILLHDVDVTAGNENGTIVLFGFVDLDKLDAETFKLITADVKTALSGKVTFLTGSGKKRTE
jgi:hypothetical protein